MQPNAIRAQFESDHLVEIFAYNADTGAFLRVMSSGQAFGRTDDGEVLVGSLDHDMLEAGNPDRLGTQSVERPIPSVLAIDVPRDHRFEIIRDNGSITTYSAALHAGSRFDAGLEMLPLHRVEYDIDSDGFVVAHRKFAADDPETVIAEAKIDYEVHFDTWQIAPMHGSQALVSVDRPPAELFTAEGLSQTIREVRERHHELREILLAEGRLDPPGDGLSAASKVGLVTAAIVLVAIGAMIFRKIRT